MKTKTSILEKNKTQAKSAKVFKPLTNHQLESVLGGPIASRGTETTVQSGG